MRATKRIKHTVITAAGLTTGIAAQTGVLAGVFGYLPDLPGYILLFWHIGGSLIAGCVYFQIKDTSRYVFFYLAFIFGMLMPVAGIVCTALTYCYRVLSPGQRQTEADWAVASDTDEVTDSDNQLEEVTFDQNQFLLANLDLESFVDILNGTDLDLKRSVIEKLSDDDKKDNIQLLQKALQDPDPEIRFYASTSLKKIEENFHKYLLAIQKELQFKPDSLDQNLLLGKEYFRFARSGLLDQTSTRFYHEQALETLEKALALEPNNIQALIETGKAYLQLELYDRSLDCLERAYSIDQDNWQILIWRCEVYFQLKQYDKIQSDCERLSQLKSPWDSVQNITQYWVAYA